MHRRASVLFFGLFAVSAALQGAAACNSSPATTPGEDAGLPDSSNQVVEDSGTVTQGCSGPLPVMTVKGPNGTQIAPDWSCYVDGAAFFFHPFDSDGGDDAEADADAPDAPDSAVVTDAQVDSSSPVDASPPPVDSSVADATEAGPDASGSYALHLTDFLTSMPPVGATVNFLWGSSSLVDASATGTVNAGGVVLFPTPPSGQNLLSFYVAGDGQAPLYWLSAIIAAPPAQTTGNSISVTTKTELLAGVLNGQAPDPTKAVIVTGAEDCQYRDVNGGQFQVIDTTTGLAVASGSDPGDPRAFYLNSVGFPGPTCTFTNNAGRAVWSMINAPADVSGRYELQFMGRMEASQTAPVLLGKTPVESYADTVTIHRAFRLNTSPPN